MSSESSSYTINLDYPTPAKEPLDEDEKKFAKRKVAAWSTLGTLEFLMAIFAIGYASYMEDEYSDEAGLSLRLWLQIYGVADAIIILVEAWLIVRVTLDCNAKILLIEMTTTVAAILFFIAWSIVGVVLLLDNPYDEKVWLFALVVILYQPLRFVVLCGFKKL